jgi:hypothetical protein
VLIIRRGGVPIIIVLIAVGVAAAAMRLGLEWKLNFSSSQNGTHVIDFGCEFAFEVLR